AQKRCQSVRIQPGVTLLLAERAQHERADHGQQRLAAAIAHASESADRLGHRVHSSAAKQSGQHARARLGQALTAGVARQVDGAAALLVRQQFRQLTGAGRSSNQIGQASQYGRDRRARGLLSRAFVDAKKGRDLRDNIRGQELACNGTEIDRHGVFSTTLRWVSPPISKFRESLPVSEVLPVLLLELTRKFLNFACALIKINGCAVAPFSPWSAAVRMEMSTSCQRLRLAEADKP